MRRWWWLVVTVLVAAACAPSDPAPPLEFGQTAGATVVRVNKEKAPDARMVLLEVIPNASRVLSDSDERIWRVVGSRENAVDEMALGRTPPGWEDLLRWRPPSQGSSVTVHVELTDGRRFLIEGEYR